MALMEIPGHDRDAIEAGIDWRLVDLEHPMGSRAIADALEVVGIDEVRELLEQRAYDEWSASLGDLQLVPDHEPGDCVDCGTEPTPANPVYRPRGAQLRLCRSCLGAEQKQHVTTFYAAQAAEFIERCR